MTLKAEYRELATDLKAAIRIGHPDSVLAALDGLRTFPGVAANQALDEPFLEQVILPLGRLLATPRLDEAILGRLSQEPQAAYRALAAVALGQRYFAGSETTEGAVQKLAQDRRAEVGRSLALALGELAPANPATWQTLVGPWLAAASPRLQRTGLWALECAFRQPAARDMLVPLALRWLAPCGNEPDEEVRRALVEVLIALGEAGLADEVCRLLGSWVDSQPEPDEWVITQALSAGWARVARTPALAVLDRLEKRLGATRSIRNARRSLADA